MPKSEKRSQSQGTWGTCGLCRLAPWTGPGVPKGREGKAEETGMECGFSLVITYHRSCLISFDKCTVGTQAAKSGGAGFLGFRGLLALFLQLSYNSRRLPDGPAGKEPTCNVGDAGDGVRPLHRDDPLEEEMSPTSGFLSAESHGQRSLVGRSSWGRRVRQD